MRKQAMAAEARMFNQNRPCRNSLCPRIATEGELAVRGATEVHHALSTPEWQRIGYYEIASQVVPARHISGDFVCCVPHERGSFVVLIDLMGKGLSAAMWITHIADLVYRAAEGCTDVGSLLGRLNQEIAGSRISAPLTSAVALSVDADGKVFCALAGHPPAVILRGSGRSETITAGGPLLGVFANARYECQRVSLTRGESILAFSDGLSEALVPEVSSLGDVVATVVGGAETAPEKITNLLDASNELTNGVTRDDISIVVLQRF